jgi:uncharacterized protein
MRKAVASVDSGPLIALARINLLDLLPRLFSRIFVPPAVWDEVTIRGKGLPGSKEVRPF